MYSAPSSAPLRLNRSQRLVFEFLVTNQNPERVATTSARNLARALKLGRTSCQDAIEWLNDQGLIRTYSVSRKKPSEHRILNDLVPLPVGRGHHAGDM